MTNLHKKLILLVLLAAAILGGSLVHYWQKQTAVNTVTVGGAEHIASDNTGTGESIVVYVSGAVNNPGVLQAAGGSRVLDAINLAGGLAPGADTAKINLAQVLKDGMHIHVPVLAAATSNPPAGGKAANDGKININTADKAQLDKLPGIGPALAERIIEYRQTNGGFKSAEELKKVPGIGEAKWNRLKDKITL